MHQLRALGISAKAEAIYLDLMARGALSVEDVADGTPGAVDGPLDSRPTSSCCRRRKRRGQCSVMCKSTQVNGCGR